MNENDEMKKREEAEREATARALDAAKRKRILKKVVIWAGTALALLFALWLILRNCAGGTGEQPSKSYDPFSLDNGKTFYEQSLDYDVFSDEVYADKDKGVWFISDSIEEYLLPEDRDGASPQARLFLDYFDAAIHGDGKTLNTLFTNEYFANGGNPIERYPDRFLMQKIYSIYVTKWGVTEIEETDDGAVIYDQFKVRFLIMDNNGAFRPDLADDEKSYIDLIFSVITSSGESKINRISQIVYNK